MMRRKRRIRNAALRSEYTSFTTSDSNYDYTFGWEFTVGAYSLLVTDLMVTDGSATGVNKVSIWKVTDQSIVAQKSGITFEEDPKFFENFRSRRITPSDTYPYPLYLDANETYRIGVFVTRTHNYVYFATNAYNSTDRRYLECNGGYQLQGTYGGGGGDGYPTTANAAIRGCPNFNYEPVLT